MRTFPRRVRRKDDAGQARTHPSPGAPRARLKSRGAPPSPARGEGSLTPSSRNQPAFTNLLIGMIALSPCVKRCWNILPYTTLFRSLDDIARDIHAHFPSENSKEG